MVTGRHRTVVTATQILRSRGQRGPDAMDHGTERDAPPGRAAGPGTVPADPVTGRVPLAVVVVDRDGLVSHWSRGARRLFGLPREEAIGRPAPDLLPVSGVLGDGSGGDDLPHGPSPDHDGLGPDLESSLDGRLSYPAAGRARLTVPADARVDVLWWAYPLVGPGPERLLVLAADADGLRRDYGDGGDGDHGDGGDGEGAEAVVVERIAPGFALHTDFPGADELARRLPEILPSMSVGESARIVAQVLELGYPILEFSQNDRVPVTPDWGVPRRAERRARRERAARALAAGEPVPDELRDEAEDLEYAAVRERLEFLNEVSGAIGTSLDLSRTI
ncbi:PAS domain-containing protein, partial [Streptomyces sp. SID6013]|nr:PAS domain-containing protein [Streptomyces sp. SID6013]